VSKAFKKDDDDDPPLLVPRAPLPEGSPNYVTQSGLAALRAEHSELTRELLALSPESPPRERASLKARIAELESRLASAQWVDPSEQPQDEVRFGASVEVADAHGKLQRFRIVGVDEANVREGRVAFTAPLARALFGRRVGDAVLVKAPQGEEELEIVRIEYQ
jgi:transcription elongation factor GreB